MTLKKGSGETQYKKGQTGMQSVRYTFHNIFTTLNIIDIVDQLLIATGSGRVYSYKSHMVHF